MKNIIVRLRDIEKNYGGKSVIDHLNLDVAQGEFLTLLGPSGCGKSEVLKIRTADKFFWKIKMWPAKRRITGM